MCWVLRQLEGSVQSQGGFPLTCLHPSASGSLSESDFLAAAENSREWHVGAEGFSWTSHKSSMCCFHSVLWVRKVTKANRFRGRQIRLHFIVFRAEFMGHKGANYKTPSGDKYFVNTNCPIATLYLRRKSKMLHIVYFALCLCFALMSWNQWTWLWLPVRLIMMEWQEGAQRWHKGFWSEGLGMWQCCWLK